ncbi:unnamed protein product [Phyllotreta striolata]|uniref:CHK kinase-like domain-containing protein n=1 Tax=Phyllotreta striolata TaxID=444603 RepID=A0A9N9XT93_PHYSR|nr:unnamed protein product [Phyllotreta striolata]
MEENVSLPQEVLSNLKECLHRLKLENYTTHYSKGSDKGQNYLGIITKVKVSGTDEKGDTKTVNLIIKSAPQSQEFRDYIKIDILHEREVYMYERVFVELSKLIEETDVDVSYTVPRCYLTSKTSPYEHLIFEDMISLGYVLKNRKTTLDLDNCLAVLKAYGQFHALGLALKYKKPDVYKELSDNTKEMYFNNEDKSRPSAVCLLDWQLSRCASPAVDVSYFIFACTEKALRDAHYPALLDAYHSSFVERLASSGVDPAVFASATFAEHMRKFSKYGLMMCLIAVPLFAADPDEIPDWTGHMEEGEREKMFLMERKSERYIVDKLTGIAGDFDRLGYI